MDVSMRRQLVAALAASLAACGGGADTAALSGNKVDRLVEFAAAAAAGEDACATAGATAASATARAQRSDRHVVLGGRIGSRTVARRRQHRPRRRRHALVQRRLRPEPDRPHDERGRRQLSGAARRRAGVVQPRAADARPRRQRLVLRPARRNHARRHGRHGRHRDQGGNRVSDAADEDDDPDPPGDVAGPVVRHRHERLHAGSDRAPACAPAAGSRGSRPPARFRRCRRSLGSDLPHRHDRPDARRRVHADRADRRQQLHDDDLPDDDDRAERRRHLHADAARRDATTSFAPSAPVSRRARRRTRSRPAPTAISGSPSTPALGSARSTRRRGWRPSSVRCTSPASSITAGPDGNVWFAERAIDGSSSVIGRVTPAGVITEFKTTPVPGSIVAMTQAPTAASGSSRTATAARPSAGSIRRRGTFTIYSSGLNGAFTLFGGIALGGDGNVWFTSYFDGLIGRVTPSRRDHRVHWSRRRTRSCNAITRRPADRAARTRSGSPTRPTSRSPS